MKAFEILVLVMGDVFEDARFIAHMKYPPPTIVGSCVYSFVSSESDHVLGVGIMNFHPVNH